MENDSYRWKFNADKGNTIKEGNRERIRRIVDIAPNNNGRLIVSVAVMFSATGFVRTATRFLFLMMRIAARMVAMRSGMRTMPIRTESVSACQGIQKNQNDNRIFHQTVIMIH